MVDVLEQMSGLIARGSQEAQTSSTGGSSTCSSNSERGGTSLALVFLQLAPLALALAKILLEVCAAFVSSTESRSPMLSYCHTCPPQPPPLHTYHTYTL